MEIEELAYGSNIPVDPITGLLLPKATQYWTEIFGMSRADFFNDTLRLIIDWEGKEFGVRRSLIEAHTLCYKYTEDEVTEEWESYEDKWAHLEEMDEWNDSSWLYTCLGSSNFTLHEVFTTFNFLQAIGYKPKKIIDFHSVIGLHSLVLAKLWPDVPITYFHPVPRTYEFARNCLFPRWGENQIEIVTDVSQLDSADLICSYEVFERDPHPMPLLRECLWRVTRFLSMSNCWTRPARTHFPEYDIDGVWIPKEKVTRAYNEYLAKSLKKVARGWNSRPIIWVPRGEN